MVSGTSGFLQSDERLQQLVAESRSILGWHEVIDGRATQRIETDTFERAVRLLEELTRRAAESPSVRFPLPRISPSPDGSIDLLWEDRNFELLINVPAGSRSRATFAGEKANQIRLTGETDPEKPADILLKWIQTP